MRVYVISRRRYSCAPSQCFFKKCDVAKLLASLPVMRSLCIRNFVEPLHCTVDTACTVCIVGSVMRITETSFVHQYISNEEDKQTIY